MSVSIKNFVENKFKRNQFKKIEHPVLIFLKKKKRAFKVNEIVKATKMNKNTIRSMLRKLIKQKIVEHKSPYFAYKEYCK